MKSLAPLTALSVCLLAASSACGQSVLVPALQPVPCPVQTQQRQVSGDRVLAFQVALGDLAKQYRLRPLLAAKLRKASRDKAFCEMLASKYSAQLDEVALQTAGGDQFFAFLKFIMDNQDSILRLVITLIDLFSAAETESFAGC
jgi:hypothetical protein